MSKRSKAPRLKVRNPGKSYLDENPEYVPVDAISVDDILKEVTLDDPALKALGISKEQVANINAVLKSLKEKRDGKKTK
jgi:hypothetical protein